MMEQEIDKDEIFHVLVGPRHLRHDKVALL